MGKLSQPHGDCVRTTDSALRQLIRETILEGLVDIPRLVRDANGLMDQADAQLSSDRFDAFYNEITFLIDELESGSATPARAQQFKRSIEDITDRYGIKSSESSKSYDTSMILSKWVGDSQTVNAAERKHLADTVAGSKLSLGSIERVMPDPKLEVGEVIDWTGDVVSFSKLRFSRGASVYQFHAGKGSCILQIVRPTRGLVIDYDSVEHTFGRRGENEVLVTGKYQVVSEETANEVPVYVIEEI